MSLTEHLPATFLEVEDFMTKDEEYYKNLNLFEGDAHTVEVERALAEEPVDWHKVIGVAHLALTQERLDA